MLIGCLLAVPVAFAALGGNIAVVAFVAALLVAPFLMMRPVFIIWLLLVVGLLVAGVLPIWIEDSANKLVWGLSALSFLLLLVMVVKALTSYRFTAGTPVFIWLAIAFMIFAVGNTILQWSSPYETLSGIKRYFQAYGLLIALTWLPLHDTDFRRWRRFFILVALLQLPWAIYERFRLVPIREGLKVVYPGIIPIDVVAGTFGAHLYEGGASGAMAMFSILVSSFLIARWRFGLIRGVRVPLLAGFILSPVFLGETKIVIVLLPITFLMLYRREFFRRPHVVFFGLLFGVILTVASGYTYVRIMGYNSIESYIEQTIKYTFQSKGHGGQFLNRTSALQFWFEEQSWSNPVSAVVGNGLGSAHEATGGHVARRYPGYGIGLTAATTLLWELGMVGLLLSLGVPLMAWRAAAKLAAENRDPEVRADAIAIEAAMPMFVVFLFYRTDALQTLSYQIVFACVLGYLAWLHRRSLARVVRQ